MTASLETTPKYRIGTVAQLTGLTADTIRAWERRYSTIAPVRSPGGTRLYSDADVIRLQLMHALTEAGHAIGAIAALGTSELRERLSRIASAQGAGSRRAPLGGRPSDMRLAVLDGELPTRLRWNPEEAAGLSVAAWSDSAEGLLAALRSEAPVDALVVHLSRLGPDPLARLDELVAASAAPVAVVLYEFATRRVLSRITDRGVHLLRGPASVGQLRLTLQDQRMIADVEGSALRTPGVEIAEPIAAAPRRFDDEQIARLLELRPTLGCECPRHLAQIVSGLVAFENYSNSCESRSPEDAQLHAWLATNTARARTIVEQMLETVCKVEGLQA